MHQPSIDVGATPTSHWGTKFDHHIVFKCSTSQGHPTRATEIVVHLNDIKHSTNESIGGLEGKLQIFVWKRRTPLKTKFDAI